MARFIPVAGIFVDGPGSSVEQTKECHGYQREIKMGSVVAYSLLIFLVQVPALQGIRTELKAQQLDQTLNF